MNTDNQGDATLMGVTDKEHFPDQYPAIIYRVPWYLRLFSKRTVLNKYKSFLKEVGRLPSPHGFELRCGNQYIIEVVNGKKLEKV